MPDTTTNLLLPYLLASQAQKHVTHNDALRLLDGLVHLAVLDRDLTAPPGSPAEGARYIVAAGATGAWAGWAGDVAYRIDGAWIRLPARAGWRAWVQDEARLLVFDGADWIIPEPPDLQNLPGVGINGSYDATNKLVVASAATLFTNVGNGHQLAVNKAAAGDTASLLAQTGGSGRAEMGTLGDDNFGIKVSPDGSVWSLAFSVDATTALVTLGGALSLGSEASPIAAVHPLSIFNSGSTTPVIRGLGPTTFQVQQYTGDATGPTSSVIKNRGTFSAPAAVQANDTLGIVGFGGYDGSNAKTGAQMLAVVMAGTPSASDFETEIRLRAIAAGSGSLSNILLLSFASGLRLFGSNVVIDGNRMFQLRSTTIAGAIIPSAAGKLAFHSNAQGGAGEVVVDSGSAYRHVGQAAVRRLTTNENATYTPRLDGRIIRDVATLTTDRNLTLSTTNVTAGHKVEVSRRGASGGFLRRVYQADGTTLIADLADNAAADFIYDGTAGAWFEK